MARRNIPPCAEVFFRGAAEQEKGKALSLAGGRRIMEEIGRRHALGQRAGAHIARGDDERHAVRINRIHPGHEMAKTRIGRRA